MSADARLAHWVEYGLFRAAVGAGVALGGAGVRIAGAAGRFGYRPLGIRRRVVESYLRFAFPDRDEKWVRRTAADSYAHIAREALTTFRYARLGSSRLLRDAVVEGIDVFRESLDAGTGAILVGGHLGNWELGGAILPASGIPLDAVVRRQRNPLFDRAINASRSRFGIRVIDRSQATRAVMAGLRANHVIALIADQDARGAGIFVPFFGRQASSPRGPAVMALRTGAPLVLMVPLRMPDGRLEVRFRRIEVDRSGDPEAAARRITAAFANGLEAGVREAPEQYLWQHRRWKTRPPQEQRRRDPV